MKNNPILGVTRRLATSAGFLAALFAFCAATCARADITKINPVTGATESYTYKFIGTDSVWNNAANWQDSNGSNPSAVPAASNSNTWAPILFDQAENQSIAIGAALSVEGWNLRMGLYNGASVQLNNLVKLQSDTATWITVDSSSHCTIAHMVNKKLVGANPLCLYSANEGGIAWTEELSSSGNGNGTPLPFHYYLAGNGTVAYNGGIAAAAGGAHVIKQADVTLSGTSQVSSKTLVSFTSSSTTFTADAAIKVYGLDGTTLKKLVGVTAVRQSSATIANTSSVLTTADAVGTCEIVQCTDGIVLYYVDGAPSAVTGYKPSININFTSGTALSTAADVGLAGYAVPGTSWNNLSVANNATLSSLNKIDSTGAATASSASVTITNTRGEWHCSSLVATSDLRAGYIDETADVTTPTVTVSGIPYDQYKVVVYTATDAANVAFGYVTVNGTNYTYVNNELTEGTTAWGASGAQNTAEALAEGVNVLVSPVVSGGTLTVVGHRSGTNPRGCIAAVQIVKVEQTVGENDLLIELDGNQTYTFDEAKNYSGTVYVTGSGTLMFDGAASTAATLHIGPAAAVNMVGSALTPIAVTGYGTAIYDGVKPTTGLGWTDSDNWTGTVWVKNIAESAKSAWNLADYGNARSTLRFTAVNLYFPNNTTSSFAGTVELDGDGMNVCDGYGGSITTIARLTGSGTLSTSGGSSNGNGLTINDASAFTGTITLTKFKVVIGTATGTSASGVLQIDSGAVATVASGKTWTAPGGFVVNGTLNADGTLASSHASQAVSGSGTVVFTGRAPTPTGDTWWKNANWTGTVQIAGVSNMTGNNTGTQIAFNDYGNEGSIVELNNVTGWLPNNFTCTPKLKVTGTLSLNNGSSGKDNAFKVGTLLGSGTISGSSSAPTAVFNVTSDWSGFTGGIGLNSSKCVVFGETIPDTLAAGTIYISEGAVAEIKTSDNWWATGGIVVNGTLKANSRDRWGGGTAMTLGDTGILELTSTSNTEDSGDYSSVTGTGTIKYSSTAGWRTFPVDDAKAPSTTLTIQVELADSLIITRDAGRETVIGNLAGSKNIRSDWNPSGSGSANNARTLTVTQSKDTEWQGKFVSNRITQFNVNRGASTTGTLTLSGTQTETVPAAINGSVNLTGTWKGATTVAGTFGGTGTLTGAATFSDNATFKVFDTDGADGLNVSGAVTVGNGVTVTIADGVTITEATTILTAASFTGTFALASGLEADYELAQSETKLTITPIGQNIYVDGDVVGYMDGTTAVITNTSAAISMSALGSAIRLKVYPSSGVLTLNGITPSNFSLLSALTFYLRYNQTELNITGAFPSSTQVSMDQTGTYLVDNGDGTYTAKYMLVSGNSVVVNEETISVAPALRDSGMACSSVGTPTYSVKTIPGLWYTVKAADNPAMTSAVSGTAVQATSATTEVTAPAFSGNLKYYKVAVGVTEEEL